MSDTRRPKTQEDIEQERRENKSIIEMIKRIGVGRSEIKERNREAKVQPWLPRPGGRNPENPAVCPILCYLAELKSFSTSVSCL